MRQISVDGSTSRRFFFKRAQFHIAKNRHRNRTRDRGGRHHQIVWIYSAASQRDALPDTKLVLLIDDAQPQVRKLQTMQQRLSANQQINLAAFGRSQNLASIRRTE